MTTNNSTNVKPRLGNLMTISLYPKNEMKNFHRPNISEPNCDLTEILCEKLKNVAKKLNE